MWACQSRRVQFCVPSGLQELGRFSRSQEGDPLAVGAFELFGPIIGLLAALGAVVFHEYRRRQIQD
jgi:hypothetical protein